MRWIAAGALVLAGAAAWLFTPAELPSPSVSEFEIPPAASKAACPGPQRLPIGDAGTSGDLAAESDDIQLAELGAGASFPVGLGRGWDAPLAASFERIGSGDLSGLAAVTCLTAGFDEWLVGGATTLGSSARLVLSNPSDAPAEARITLYGPLGQIDDTVVIAVAPRGQEERLIEGFAAELSTLAVHVETTGPGLVAVLQDSRLAGFQPAGTDWVSATTPLTRQVIPSVGSDAENATATLRLLAPEGAKASVTLVTGAGVEAWSGARVIELEPGVVTDISVPVNRLGALEITSDTPILAAARTVVPRAPKEGLEGDIAYEHRWVSGVSDAEQSTFAAIVPADGTTVAAYSPVGGKIVFVDEAGNELASAVLAPRTATRIPLPVAAGTFVTATGRFAWALEVENDEGFLTALMPADTTRVDSTVTMIPAPYAPVVTAE